MKIRKRLTIKEANFLGIKPKLNEKGRSTARYYIEKDEWEEIFQKRIKPNKRKFVETQKKFDKAGGVLSSIQKLQSKPIDIPENFEVIKISTSKTTGQQWIQYAPIKEDKLENEYDLKAIRLILNKEIKKKYNYTYTPSSLKVEGVLKWSDLHFGAHIRNLIKTPNYDSNILLDGLLESVEDLNSLGFEKTHIHINGDLIESFTGLSHINSWMSLDKNQIGANSIILCCELLEKALNKIKNLASIKIVAGNHDRITSNNKEDVKGGAAELIAWGLTLKGFDVEFNPMIITHKVNGINHINLHGHLGLSKRSSSDIILDYGIQGCYNLICEAHLHSHLERLSIKQRSAFKMVSDDSINYRRMHLQSFFTGNYYSESLGYTTNAGYSIFWDNGKGKPKYLNATR